MLYLDAHAEFAFHVCGLLEPRLLQEILIVHTHFILIWNWSIWLCIWAANNCIRIIIEILPVTTPNCLIETREIKLTGLIILCIIVLIIVGLKCYHERVDVWCLLQGELSVPLLTLSSLEARKAAELGHFIVVSNTSSSFAAAALWQRLQHAGRISQFNIGAISAAFVIELEWLGTPILSVPKTTMLLVWRDRRDARGLLLLIRRRNRAHERRVAHRWLRMTTINLTLHKFLGVRHCCHSIGRLVHWSRIAWRDRRKSIH